MTQHEMPIQGGSAANIIQLALQGLWEKAQKAADRIKGLREENENLQQRVTELEGTVSELQSQLTEQVNYHKELKEKSATLSSVDVGDGLLYLSPDEREALERQISDLIARINAHLGSGSR